MMGLLDRPGQPQRYGLLDPGVMRLIQSGGPRVAPAPARPQRERVSGWRVLDRVLGGQTVSEGLDGERARLEAEAMRPQADARMAQMRAAANRMGPEAMIAFETNPEAFGESLGMQYRPVTTAAGSITSYGPGDGARRVSAPVVDRFDDRHGVFDPLNPQAGTQYTAPRGPTEGERIDAITAETGRINATNGVNVGPGAQLRNPQTGALIATGADRIFSAADATDLVDENRNLIYQNQRDAPVGPTPGSQEIAGQLSAIDTDVDPVLRDMQGLLQSGDVITGFGAEARLAAARAAAGAGNADARRQVAATERYRNMSGRLRVGMAKSLGANPSNADIALLERVTAGDISQTREGLLATLQDGASLAQRQRAALSARAGGQAGAPQRAPAPAARPRAVNPQTGAVVEFDGQSWVPVR